MVGEPDARKARPREVIARQVRHLSRLVDDLREASSLASGKVVLERSPVDLAECATRTLGSLRAAGRLAQHVVTHETAPAWVDADETRLEQIVTNLLTNSLKYTPAGGHIRVTVAPEADVAVLRIADDGIGIPADLLPRIFDLFGLGLTVVRRLTELQGGSVGAASDGPGRGATFTVSLPRIAEPASRAAEPPAAVAVPPRRVLIVEDNQDAREMLRATLQLAGHELRTASDGASGVAEALAYRPEVALIDIGLPGLDGYEVARQLRETAAGRRMRLVAVTGYGQPEDRRRAEGAGFDAHLVKPVDFARLMAALALPAGSERGGSPPDLS